VLEEQAPETKTVLSYSVTPSTAYISNARTSETNETSLVIQVSNSTSKPVNIKKFIIDIPVSISRFTDVKAAGLFADPSTWKMSPPSNQHEGFARISCEPNGMSSGLLKPHQGVTFVIKNVVINDIKGVARIRVVTILDSGVKEKFSQTISKQRPPLQILSFRTENPYLKPGEKARLRWDITGATRVTLETPENHDVSRNWMIDVTTTRDVEVYTLKASRGDEIREEQVTVITSRPSILDFAFSRHFVVPGTRVSVQWATTGADEVVIKSPGDKKQVGPSGKHEYTVEETTTFELEALDSKTREVSRAHRIVVVRPVIESFDAKRGQDGAVRLQWNTKGASRCFVVSTPPAPELAGVFQCSEGGARLNTDGPIQLTLTAVTSYGQLTQSNIIKVPPAR
jgi:hypothetical protein